MIPYERRKIMLAELGKREVVSLDDFCRVLGDVSQSTVRRDLRTLEDEGQIVLLQGGAAKMRSGSYDTPLNSRNIMQVEQKEAIARTAADLVQDGEVIYIDAGSTALRMIKYLKHKHISIVTTNAMVFPEIAETHLECTLVGGEILRATASLVGPMTDNILRGMYFDKAFIGTTGYDLQAGVSTPDYREANKKRIVKDNSKEVYVLADSTKEGKRAMCKAFELKECILITEKETPFVRDNTRCIIAK
jgi:DeoR family fructose operon transcriptional repressor